MEETAGLTGGKGHCLEQFQLLELQHKLRVLALGWSFPNQLHKGLEELHGLRPQPWRVSSIWRRRQHRPEQDRSPVMMLVL